MKKLLITGANGLMGSEINGDIKIGKEYDLRDPHQSDEMISKNNPTHVIHCAAKVGGIAGNMNAMGEYFYDNLISSSFNKTRRKKKEVENKEIKQ